MRVYACTCGLQLLPWFMRLALYMFGSRDFVAQRRHHLCGLSGSDVRTYFHAPTCNPHP